MMTRGPQLRSVEDLGDLAPDDPEHRKVLQRVFDTFPVKISRHLQRLMARSEPVARQFLPDVREVLDGGGQRFSFAGILPTGIDGVERMYLDRCIIMPHQVCPAYCRYCFRKFYEHGAGSSMTYDELDRAIAYVAADPKIREVLITGGEPVMDPRRLAHLLAGLRRVDHVGPLRIACRSLVLAPELITDALVQLLRDHQDLRRGRPLEVAGHFNHPDEISAETIDAIARLREAGIHVYNQTVLLRTINTDAGVLAELVRELRRYGVESYYLFLALPVRGMEHLRPNVATALALKRELRRRVSGRAIPRFIVSTRMGKVELGVDGEVVEREADGRQLWISTSYDLATYRSIDPGFELPEDARLGPQGRVEVRYLDGPPD